MKMFCALNLVHISLIIASDSPDLLRMRSRILKRQQFFLDEKNKHYIALPEELIALSSRCAEKRDLKACSALVKGVRAFVEQEKATCPAVIEQLTSDLIRYQCASKKHIACLQDCNDAVACEALRIEAAEMLLKLAEFNASQSCCLGIKGGFIPLRAGYDDDVCNALHRVLSERRKIEEHDQPTLLSHARMLDYAVREYRARAKRSGDVQSDAL